MTRTWLVSFGNLNSDRSLIKCVSLIPRYDGGRLFLDFCVNVLLVKSDR
jgi:hypothetical protein